MAVRSFILALALASLLATPAHADTDGFARCLENAVRSQSEFYLRVRTRVRAGLGSLDPRALKLAQAELTPEVIQARIQSGDGPRTPEEFLVFVERLRNPGSDSPFGSDWADVSAGKKLEFLKLLNRVTIEKGMTQDQVRGFLFDFYKWRYGDLLGVGSVWGTAESKWVESAIQGRLELDQASASVLNALSDTSLIRDPSLYENTRQFFREQGNWLGVLVGRIPKSTELADLPIPFSEFIRLANEDPLSPAFQAALEIAAKRSLVWARARTVLQSLVVVGALRITYLKYKESEEKKKNGSKEADRAIDQYFDRQEKRLQEMRNDSQKRREALEKLQKELDSR